MQIWNSIKNSKPYCTSLVTEFGTTLPTSPGLFSVREASWFLFKSLLVHLYNAEWSLEWSGLVRSDLWNHAQLTTPESDVPSSQKSSDNISTSTAFLPQLALTWLCLSISALQNHQKASKASPTGSTGPWLNSWESWLQSPTSSQGLGS